MFNLSKTLVLILSATALSSTAINAFAADGTITITGKVVDETCILTGGSNTNGKGKDITVTLDTVKKSVFSDTAKVAGNKAFDLQLSSAGGTGACDAVTNSGFKGIHITTAASADHTASGTALINKAGSASTNNPVYIQLLTNKNTLVNYTQPWKTQAMSEIVTKDGKPTLTYQAQYFTETGTVDPQDVQAVVNYTLQYN